jgi:hypothetical protein
MNALARTFLLRIDLICKPRRGLHMADRTGGSQTPVEGRQSQDLGGMISRWAMPPGQT